MNTKTWHIVRAFTRDLRFESPTAVRDYVNAILWNENLGEVTLGEVCNSLDKWCRNWRKRLTTKKEPSVKRDRRNKRRPSAQHRKDDR